MNKISSFVRLDFYTLKPYKMSLLVLLALAITMTIGFQSLTTLCFYLMMCLIMIMVYPFSIGEANRLDTLYATLSLKRRNIVVGRYVFALCMEILAVVLVLILSWGFSIFTTMEFIFPEILFYLCIASFLFSTIVSVQYPIYFKLGYNKAKFIAYVPLLLIFFGFILLPNMLRNSGITQMGFDDFLKLLMTYKLAAYAVPVAVGHLLLGLSCTLSCRLYERRDI